MSRNLKRLLLVFLIAVFTFSFSHDSRVYSLKTPVHYPADLFQDGDLIFRKGTGMFSNLFSSVGKERSIYSHVGLVIKKGSRVFVIHSEANELTGIGWVKEEPIEDFLNDDNAISGSLYRLKNNSITLGRGVARIAKILAENRIPFDTDFDMETEDHLYCTELIWLVYKKAGVNLIKVPDFIEIPVLRKHKNIVTPGGILNSGKLILIDKIKENT